MNGLDKSVDIQFMSGKELMQLCIGSYQVILNFGDQMVVTLESTFSLIDKDGAILEIRCDAPKQTAELACLLDSSIDKAINRGGGRVCLEFSNGYIVELSDENRNEESYSIVSAEDEIFV